MNRRICRRALQPLNAVVFHGCVHAWQFTQQSGGCSDGNHTTLIGLSRSQEGKTLHYGSEESNDPAKAAAALLRYAIAVRRIPEVRWARAAFLGRAIHRTLEE